MKKHHPKDRLERRSIEAKALELKQFRQRKISAKRKIQTEIEEKETSDELRRVSSGEPLERGLV